jgi:surface protein
MCGFRLINIISILLLLIFQACSGGGGSSSEIDEAKKKLGLTCNFEQLDGTITQNQEVLSGNSIEVVCEQGAFFGGGRWYCGYDGEFDGKICEKISFTQTSYAIEEFHCDLNDDGIVDSGEELDFPNHSFVTKWQVAEGDLEIELPIVEDDRLDFYVDWGDGKCSRINNDNFEQRIHSYSNEDNSPYQVRIIGKVLRWGGSNVEVNYRNKLIEVVELGDVYWEDLENAFSDLVNLVLFNGVNTNTSFVTNMASMFQGSTNIVNFVLDGITTQTVTDMSYMFEGMTVEDLDIAHFVTPSLINIEGMFAGMTSLTSLNILGLITKNVTTMENLFRDSTSLATINYGDYFDTSNVATMKYMFSGTKIINLDLSSFKTSNVIDMRYMFEAMSELLSINWGNNFVTTKVIYMDGMFSNVEKLISLDLSHFNTSLVESMKDLFSGTSLLVKIIFGDYFFTTNVTDMSQMFLNSGVTSLDLSSWNVDKVTNMEKMFFNTINLVNLYFGQYWITSNVVNMYLMFANSGVTSLDLSYFDTGNVGDLRGMFQNTSDLLSITFSENFSPSSATSMSSLFDSSGVTNLDLSYWDTSNVIDMNSMFKNTEGLRELILGGDFSTTNVTNFSYFLHGSGVSDFDFSSLNTSSGLDMSFMLSEMINQEDYDLTSFSTSIVTTMQGMLESLESVTELDISAFDISNVINFSSFLNSDTLNNASLINLGEHENDDIIPDGFDLTTVSIVRVCSKNLAYIHSDTDIELISSYFDGENNISLSNEVGPIVVACNSNSSKPGKSVKIYCNASTGEITESSDSENALDECIE